MMMMMIDSLGERMVTVLSCKLEEYYYINSLDSLLHYQFSLDSSYSVTFSSYVRRTVLDSHIGTPSSPPNDDFLGHRYESLSRWRRLQEQTERFHIFRLFLLAFKVLSVAASIVCTYKRSLLASRITGWIRSPLPRPNGIGRE